MTTTNFSRQRAYVRFLAAQGRILFWCSWYRAAMLLATPGLLFSADGKAWADAFIERANMRLSTLDDEHEMRRKELNIAICEDVSRKTKAELQRKLRGKSEAEKQRIIANLKFYVIADNPRSQDEKFTRVA